MWREDKMKNGKIVLSKIAYAQRLKPFRTTAALILTTLMLMVAAATTMATAQTYTDLFNFDGTHGGDPHGQLLQGRNGNLYGTTFYGGDLSDCWTMGCGTIFKITTTGTLTTFYRFLCDVNICTGYAYRPEAGLVLGPGGTFYGTTEYGGANNRGTVFKITPTGTLTILYSSEWWSDYPTGGLIRATDGNFYGTTEGVGGDYGTVFKITPGGTLTTLYTFCAEPGCTDGAYPYAGLVQATDGKFYGTTSGGANGYGTVFKIAPAGILTTLHSFNATDGGNPSAALVQATAGNFYGTTYSGGANGYGTVFKISPGGTLTTLHSFNNTDGANPVAGLVQATDGIFYGTTSGGANGYGTVFKITPGGRLTTLHSFDSADGAPVARLIQATDGSFYGTTTYDVFRSGGTVFKLDVGLGPFVSLVRDSGKVGKTIEVLGQGFTGTTAVSFNGTAATFTVERDTYLKATVPSGATTGPVTVTTPGASLNSNTQFRVTPKILSFSPTSGPVGTPVTITGNSLIQTTRVGFDWMKAASFTVNSDTQVTAVVPTGAMTGRIQIRTKGGLAVSGGVFTVTQ
jgi:uncharacterized repeat protein (TIGR03803 family)